MQLLVRLTGSLSLYINVTSALYSFPFYVHDHFDDDAARHMLPTTRKAHLQPQSNQLRCLKMRSDLCAAPPSVRKTVNQLSCQRWPMSEFCFRPVRQILNQRISCVLAALYRPQKFTSRILTTGKSVDVTFDACRASMLDLLLVGPKFTRPACRMQPTMRIAGRCTALPLPRALPLRQSNGRTNTVPF